MAQLEVKKMKQGMSYSCKEKTIILNVFKYFRTHFPDKCVTEIVRRTAKATGCSEKSIFQFRKEEASVEGFKEPSKTKIRKNININSRDIKYDCNVRQAIRHIIYDLRYRNIVPSLNTILKQVNSDSQLPNFSLMTLRRLMFDMGFYYEKNGNKSILAERPATSKDNTPQKQPHTKPNKASNGSNSRNTIACNNMNNEPKQVPPPQVPHNISNMQNTQINPHMAYPQNQRLIQMHMPPPENHMMPPIHAPAPHNMPVMINHRRDFMAPPPHAMGPPNMDMHLKREVPPWMHSHNMIKQQ